MQSKKYVFYTLISTKNIEDVRYVGVTTKTIQQRLSQHKYVASNPKKRSTPVAKWIYSNLCNGYEIITTEIDSCDENEWEEKEVQLISDYKEKGFNLLNVDKGGKGVITKDKRNKEGMLRSAEAHEIPIIQLSLSGEYINEYKSIIEATKILGFSSKSAISNVLSGRSKSADKSFWVKKELYEKGEYKLPVYKPTALETKGKKYYKYCPDTFKLVEIYLSERAMIMNELGNARSNHKAIYKAIKNKITWHEYFWSNEEITDFSEYFNDIYKILEINSNGEIINKFKTQIEVADYLGLKHSTISNKIKDKTVTKNNTYLIKNTKN